MKIHKEKNIYEHIQRINQRMAMYIGDRSLLKLEAYLHGYQSGLHIHEIKEEGLPDFYYFYEWLMFEHGINTIGGCRGILEKCNNNEEVALKLFFSYVDEYSKITIEDGERFDLPINQERSPEFLEANPGFTDEPIPNQAQIIYFKPGTLCYLRYWYHGKLINQRGLEPDKDSALFRANWEFGLQLKT